VTGEADLLEVQGEVLEQHAFISAPNGGALRDLGSLGGTVSLGRSINARGQVAGYSLGTQNNHNHAFVSGANGGSLTDLGTLGGDNSFAYGLNDSGEVVGSSELISGSNVSHGFLYRGSGSIIDLNTLTVGPLAIHVDIYDARGINNSGWIIATGLDSLTGLESAYLLQPVPLPAAQLAALLTEVTGVGPGTSLADKVKFAQTYYAVPDIQATCAVLTGFVKEVKAQAGKKISRQLDAKLIADAQAVEAAIGCNSPPPD